MSNSQLVSQISIKVDGNEVSAEVIGDFLGFIVDQQVHMPGMFAIRFVDMFLNNIDGGPFDLTKSVKISAAGVDGVFHVLIDGEITALEPEYGVGMIAELVVRGYDKSHRLFREVKSAAFLNKKDSDLAREIAGNASLSTQIDATSAVYDHIFQNNQSDLAFLM